jgi:hypothetical protein
MKNNFETFSDIQDIKLRVYNRTALLFNLIDDFGESTGQEYLEVFTEGERMQMMIMSTYIKNNGLEETRKEVTRGLTLVPEEDLDEQS